MDLFGVHVLRGFNNIDLIKRKEMEAKSALSTPSIASDDMASDSFRQDILSRNNNFQSDINNYVAEQSDRRLLHMIEINEERFSKIIRKWVRSEIESRYTQ